MKRFAAMLLSVLMVAAAAVPVFGAEEPVEAEPQMETKEVTVFDLKTGEESATTETFEVTESDQEEPDVVRASRSMLPDDPEAVEHLASVGLLDENGDFDVEAWAALPSDEPEYEGEMAVSPFSLIGTKDRRTAVSSKTASPYKYVAMLTMTWSDGTTRRGTGTVYGYKHILSCAHNVYGKDADKPWSYNKKVSSVTAVLSNGQRFSTNSVMVSDAWKSAGAAAEDYSVLIFGSQISTNVGRCGIASTTANLEGQTVEIPGYPSFAPNGSGNLSTMYTHKEKVTRYANSRLYYNVDTSEGQSGSPVFYNGAYVCAIHAKGKVATYGNSGRRIDASLKSWLDKYRNS